MSPCACDAPACHTLQTDLDLNVECCKMCHASGTRVPVEVEGTTHSVCCSTAVMAHREVQKRREQQTVEFLDGYGPGEPKTVIHDC